jgi:hypothetical protein
MEPVTRWEVWDDDEDVKDWRHNHIDHGHADGEFPTPKFLSQAGWTKGKWRKGLGHLDDAHVLHLDGGCSSDV